MLVHVFGSDFFYIYSFSQIKTHIPLDGDSVTIRNLVKMTRIATERQERSRSAVEAPRS